jgi:hypothetical protein
MPRYGHVRLTDMHSKLQRLEDELQAKQREIRSACRLKRPKSASESVVRDGIHLSNLSCSGSDLVNAWLRNNGIFGKTQTAEAQARIAAAESQLIAVQGTPPDTSAPKDTSVGLTKKAMTFAREYEMKTWLEEQNVVKGLAPVRTQVWQKRLQLKVSSHRVAKTKKGQKQWCRRWRKRWGVTAGRIYCREVISEVDMQQKVGTHFGCQIGSMTF